MSTNSNKINVNEPLQTFGMRAAAKYLNVSIPSLYRLINAGQINYLSFNATGQKLQKKYFLLQDLNAFLLRNRVVSPVLPKDGQEVA